MFFSFGKFVSRISFKELDSTIKIGNKEVLPVRALFPETALVQHCLSCYMPLLKVQPTIISSESSI